MDSLNDATAKSYLDFQGLGQLRGKAARDGKAALRETAQQFEALFLQMMMKSMRESIDKSDLLNSTHTSTYEALFDREVSIALARRNALGLADMLVQAQERQMSAMSTEQALQAREAGAAPSVRSLDAPAQVVPLRDAAAQPAPKLVRQPGPLSPLAPKQLGGGER